MNRLKRFARGTLKNFDKLTLGLFVTCVFGFIAYIIYLGVVG